MIISLALALLAIVSGTLASYVYDEGGSLGARICGGACVGLTLLGLVGFVIASFLGLTPLSISLTAALLSTPILLLIDKNRRRVLNADLALASQALRNPDQITLGYAVFYAGITILMWRIFDRAVIVGPEGISTGLLNNFGDLPFHISVITGFAFGNNFPPQDPTFAGVQFTYPFLTDFVSAIFVACGANLRESMFIENFIVAVAFVGLVHRWALVMLRDRLAAVVTPLLVLLNGGLGWVLLWDAYEKQGLYWMLQSLPPSFTVIPETTWRWGNAISSLLVPQRGILLGLPLAVMVFTQWWLATGPDEEKSSDDLKRGKEATEKQSSTKTREIERQKAPGKKRPQKNRGRTANLSASHGGGLTASVHVRPWHRMVAAGIIAGLLPLVHAHSFVVVMMVGVCIGLLQRRWLDWLIFIAVASAVALPQMWWSTHHSAVDASKFFEWQFGWDRGNDDASWFWFKNTGFFIPLIVAAIVWPGRDKLVSRRLLIFYLPFTLCFIIPNVMKMAPWIWDNIKVLFYWWLASAPLVALLLARLWRGGGLQRVLAIALFVCVTLAGTLDVAVIALRSKQYEVFDARGVQFAEIVKQKTEPRALIVHAPVHNHPVFLTGRRSLMGYPGHIWTHGLEFAPRESEIRRIYAGAPDADALLAKYNIQYAVVGPHEKNVLPVNEGFFARFTKIGEVGEYRLFKISR